MRTREELKTLAIDIAEGRVFHDRLLGDDKGMLASVFMPLMLMDKAQIDALAVLKPVFFYEYYSEAGPRSVNGFPIFFSFSYLNQEELAIVSKSIKGYESRRRRFLVPWWRRIHDFVLGKFGKLKLKGKITWQNSSRTDNPSKP